MKKKWFTCGNYKKDIYLNIPGVFAITRGGAGIHIFLTKFLSISFYHWGGTTIKIFINKNDAFLYKPSEIIENIPPNNISYWNEDRKFVEEMNKDWEKRNEVIL